MFHNVLRSTVVLVLFVAVIANAAAQEYPIKPAPEHAHLKKFAGVWDAEISMTMPDADGQSMNSKGVETVKMLGELWNVVDLNYDFAGQKVHGHGVMGFDPSKKKYVGTWHESGSPYMSTMEGTHDAETKKTTYEMKSKDMAGNDADYRIITHLVDDKKRNFEMHMKIPSGEFVKFLEIKYVKR